MRSRAQHPRISPGTRWVNSGTAVSSMDFADPCLSYSQLSALWPQPAWNTSVGTWGPDQVKVKFMNSVPRQQPGTEDSGRRWHVGAGS